jgi:hypothetical protein
MPDRLNMPALRRLQLRLRPVLRPSRVQHQARQSKGQCHAGSDSEVQASAAQIRHCWFAERAQLGTPLSNDELQHGVRKGIISSSLVN